MSVQCELITSCWACVHLRGMYAIDFEWHSYVWLLSIDVSGEVTLYSVGLLQRADIISRAVRTCWLLRECSPAMCVCDSAMY